MAGVIAVAVIEFLMVALIVFLLLLPVMIAKKEDEDRRKNVRPVPASLLD